MMIRRCALPAVFACVLVATGLPAFAQESLDLTLADRIRELEASHQGVLLPLNGALDPEPAEEDVQPVEQSMPEQEVAEPEALVTPPMEQPEVAETLQVTEEPALADLPEAVEAVEAEAAVTDADAAVDVMLPDLGAIDGVVVAELGNPDSIGPYRLWLASFRTVREAQAGWQQLAKDNRDVLGDLLPVIVIKELGGESGTFFRLQAGPLAEEGLAQARCETLKSRSLYCAILGPNDG